MDPGGGRSTGLAPRMEKQPVGRGEGCCPQCPPEETMLGALAKHDFQAGPLEREPVVGASFPSKFLSGLSDHVRENICLVLAWLVSFFLDTLYFYFFNKFIYFLFIYFWLRWVFVAVRGLSLVAASGAYSSLRCAGFSLRWLLLLRSTGSRCAGFSGCRTPAQ